VKLYASSTSPYVRKVRIVAMEKGLGERLELVDAAPWPDPAKVAVWNPLGKVPALVTDDGLALFDSPVICEYLDSIGGAPALIPPNGPARWLALRCQALADGILDAAVTIVLERRRPAEQRSGATEERAAAALRRAIAALSADLSTRACESFDIGRIAAAVAIGYVDFRLPDMSLGLDDPTLMSFWTEARVRPSVATTTPG
jgi:glutathione S-transferase